MKRLRLSNGAGARRTVNIVGGGILGLCIAIMLALNSRRLGLPIDVRVFEAGAYGGGRSDRTASCRCQCWLHFQGTLYAQRQPHVAHELQRSTALLKKWAPAAFRHPLAFAIERKESEPPADECFRVLGIDHQPVPVELLKTWFSPVSLPEGAKVWRVQDGTIDLRLLGYGLKARAQRLGVELVRERVVRLQTAGEDRISKLRLANGETMSVGSDDAVVLSCGAGIRPLLGQVGVEIPGLRQFVSHLLASDAFGLRALFIALGGGNCIPHETAEGRLLNLFGNTGRTELFPEEDGVRLQTDEQAVAQLIRDVRNEFGLEIPTGYTAWPAVKTEIVPEGNHSQSHHAFRVAELSNCYVAIPGKLSASAACGEDMAIKIVRDVAGEEITTPIWEAARAA